MNSNKYKILVVEDDENINNLIATLIDTNGYKSIQAKDCSTGMMLYASHRRMKRAAFAVAWWLIARLAVATTPTAAPLTVASAV